MGKCGGPETKPYTFSLQDLQDMKVGDTKEMPRGCGPNIGGTQGGSGYDWLTKRGFGWPNNTEFEWGGLGGGCDMCSNIGGGYGCDCSGSKAIGGKRGTVKRRAFLGDPTNCCFANFNGKDSVKVVDNNTCDFEYRDPTSSQCTNVYRDHCKTGNNLITDEKCKSLVKSNSTLYNQLMKDYCNKKENAQSNSCLDWCKTNSTECTTLNLLTDCVKVGLCKDNVTKNCDDKTCTRQNVVDIKTKCQRYKFDSEQGFGIYGCTPAGIGLFENECAEFGVDLSACTPIELQNAKDNRFKEAQLQIQKESQVQSQQNYQETQDTIAQVLGLPTENAYEPVESSQTPKKETEFPYFIIVILLLICFLISSSLSSIGGFVLL